MPRFLTGVLFIIIYSICHGQVINEKGKKAYDEKKYAESIKIFSKAIKSNPENYNDFYYRGAAYIETNKLQEGYVDLIICSKLNPQFAEAYFLRALLLLNPEQANDAVNELNMAIKYARNDTIKQLSYWHRASAKLMQNDSEGAIKDCKEALKNDTSSRRARGAYATIAMAYGNQKKYELSLPILQKLYNLDSTDMRIISNLGYEYALMEKYEESLYYLDKALKLEPNGAYTISNKSYTLHKLGRNEEALKLINRSLEIAPNNSFAYKHLGLIQLELKNKTKACEAFETAHKKGFTDEYGDEILELIKVHCK